MNFHYHEILSNSYRSVGCSLLELATNVVTDWMPGTPDSMALWFADLLNNILELKWIGSERLWTLNPRVAYYEKQWKQFTSWILGIAFCRKVIEMEGYRWWAPVSAFTNPSTLRLALIPNWQQNLPAARCYIQKPIPPLSNLMPDYIIVRENANQLYEISFAESKGSRKSLESPNITAYAWRDQSRNAEFYFDNNLYPITQNLVVATRVNPFAKKALTRRVYVRACNSLKPEKYVPFEAIREVLLFHYIGICKRIGLRANANILAMASILKDHPFYIDKDEFNVLEDEFLKTKEEVEAEILHDKTKWLPNQPIFFEPKRSLFIVGRNTIRIGLSIYAMKLIKWLQNMESGNDAEIIRHFEEGVDSLLKQTKELQAKKSTEIIVRNDGLISEFVD
jgi:hypothetical protein